MRAILAVTIIGWIAAPAAADVIELKTGQRVEGVLKRVSEGKVSIEVGGQMLTLEQAKVRAIYFGTEPGKASAHSAREEALRALRALQSVTQAGVTYRDYMTRVGDTKIVVDRYLREGRGDSQTTQTSAESLHYYVLAGSAWSTKLSRGSFVELGMDPAVDACEPAQRVLAGSPYRVLGENAGLSALWLCASQKIAEAERVAGE